MMAVSFLKNFLSFSLVRFLIHLSWSSRTPSYPPTQSVKLTDFVHVQSQLINDLSLTASETMGNLHIGLVCLKILFSNLYSWKPMNAWNQALKRHVFFIFTWHIASEVIMLGVQQLRNSEKKCSHSKYSNRGTHGKTKQARHETFCFISWKL